MSAVPDTAADDPAADLERRVQAITALEAVVDGWDEPQLRTVRALKSAIEDLHKEALRRLIKALKDDPAAGARLRAALADPLIHGLLRFHGLVREPLQVRVQRAIDEVRPFLHEHGGDVELIAVVPPDAVELRLLGSCHGCPASSQTLSQGVEAAIRRHAPEIVQVRQVGKAPAEPRGEATVHFVSPFALHARSGWVDVARLDEIPEGGITERKVKERSILLSRSGGQVSCLDNRCAHLGMPLEMGEISDGVLTCPHHGFRYLLETGECLSAPEVQLTVHAVRVSGDRVQVRLDG